MITKISSFQLKCIHSRNNINLQKSWQAGHFKVLFVTVYLLFFTLLSEHNFFFSTLHRVIS